MGIKADFDRLSFTVDSSCPFEESEAVDCLDCYKKYHGTSVSEGAEYFCWHYKVVYHERQDAERAEQGNTIRLWVLSEAEKKWLEKQHEYVMAGTVAKYRMEAIFCFCHRNDFSCRLVGNYVFVATKYDEWLIGYSGSTVKLKHINQRGKRTDWHRQIEHDDVRKVLYYMRSHDGSMYRRTNMVDRLLQLQGGRNSGAKAL